jgi:hypothetical protein
VAFGLDLRIRHIGLHRRRRLLGHHLSGRLVLPQVWYYNTERMFGRSTIELTPQSSKFQTLAFFIFRDFV